MNARAAPSRRAHVVAACALVGLALGLGASDASGATMRAADAVPPNRVTMITDSVGGVLFWDADARDQLAQGLDFQIETRTCRRLVVIGCYAYGQTPPSALATIQSLGSDLGPTVVIDVGYNDAASTYAAGLDQVMQALVAANVQHVVWVTLEETRGYLTQINGVIRNAPKRWGQLVVADWAPVAAAHPSWFADDIHMNGDGGAGFASFLRPIVLGACGSPCAPPPAPHVTLLAPTVGAHVAVVRWRGNASAATYDVETRHTAVWRLVASHLTETSRSFREAPGTRLFVRVRARNAQGQPGAWSHSLAIRFKTTG